MSIRDVVRTMPKRSVGSRAKAVKGVSIAVVGCGYWGSKHVRVVSSLPDVSEVFAVDANPNIRASISAAYPNVKISADLGSIIDQVHGVIVATPPQQHAAVAREAFESHKHVLVEKPLAADLSVARSLVEQAERHRVMLMVGHTFEFNPAVRELRDRMDQGELGEILFIQSARLNLGLYRSDVNVAWDLAPHDISIMNYLLRSSPNAVAAWGSSHLSHDVVDVAHFRLDYADRGIKGYGHVSWLDPKKVRQISVVGTRKMAIYDDLAEEKLRIFDRGVDRHPDSFGNGIVPSDGTPVIYRYGDIVSPHISFPEPLMLEDKHFVDCIRDGSHPLSDGRSGLAVVEVLEAIDRSLVSGTTVQIVPPRAERSRRQVARAV